MKRQSNIAVYSYATQPEKTTAARNEMREPMIMHEHKYGKAQNLNRKIGWLCRLPCGKLPPFSTCTLPKALEKF